MQGTSELVPPIRCVYFIWLWTLCCMYCMKQSFVCTFKACCLFQNYTNIKHLVVNLVYLISCVSLVLSYVHPQAQFCQICKGWNDNKAPLKYSDVHHLYHARTWAQLEVNSFYSQAPLLDHNRLVGRKVWMRTIIETWSVLPPIVGWWSLGRLWMHNLIVREMKYLSVMPLSEH